MEPEVKSQRLPSARRSELLERAYRYVLERGMTQLSLRPLATSIGSSPRVLLFLFGSKDGLVRALLTRARQDELEDLARLRAASPEADLPTVAATVWSWLAAAEHRPLLRLWAEGYARSLLTGDGPWAGFAASTIADWLALLREAQPAAGRDTPTARAQRTLTLAVLRGALLDLLATDDLDRTTAAVNRFLAGLEAAGGEGWEAAWVGLRVR